MKLIDMLVEEGLSGWRWPEGYYSVAQDKNDTYGGNIYAYINSLSLGDYWSEDNDSGFRLLLFKGHEVAEDAATSLVTREQYEAALAAKNGGWIEWGGGECPVKKGTLVDVRYRDGEELSALPADDLAPSSRDASFAFWRDGAQNNDIIAYRLHKPKEAEQAKADGEADLNECASQDAAPVWNGEGLPPVGCECEWQDKNTKQWQPVKVVYASEWVTVVREINEERGDDLVEVAIENYGDDSRLKFRPIRSEAERKRDAAIEQMIKIATIYTTKSLSLDLALNSIYNAIAAGEITGMKLED